MDLAQLHVGTLTSLRREALAPYDTSRAVALGFDADTEELAAELCEGLALQLLARHTPGEARLVLYEAAPSRRFAELKRLLVESDGRWGEQLFNSRSCHDLLDVLNEQAHRRFAMLASAGATDLATYNVGAVRREVVTYVVLTSVEALAGEGHSLEALQNLCLQGPLVGLVPILLCAGGGEVDEGVPDFRRKPLAAFWAAVLPRAFGFDLRSTPVRPWGQPAELWRLLTRFGVVVGLPQELRARWADALVAGVALADEASPHRDFLVVPIGTEGTRRAHFALGEASNCYHALLGGASRSGKSTLLNNLILQACEALGPDELRLWLFDYREGVEFTLFEGLPHLDVLHVDNEDRQGAQDAFVRFLGLMKERAVLFRQCTPPVARLVDYNQHAASPLPRCLLIVDEAQSLFDDRESKPHAKRLLREVARKGAAFGLHVILSTQSFQNVELEPDVKAQFRLRVGLQLSNAMECRALMGRDNDAPLTLPRFTAVYNNNFGEARDNRLIALDALSREDLLQRVRALCDRYPGGGQTRDAAAVRPEPPSTAGPSSAAKGGADFADWDDLVT